MLYTSSTIIDTAVILVGTRSDGGGAAGGAGAGAGTGTLVTSDGRR